MPTEQAQAAQYLRMSTDHQRYSLANQAARIGRYAAEFGFEIVRSYEDAGRSGVTTRRRDGLKTLLRDVLGGAAPFSHVLVLDVTRWGRFQDPDEAAHYEFICREAGVRVVYCAEGFADDLGGVIVKQIKRVMAGEYSRDLSDKVRIGKRRQALRGCAQGGDAPYGFRRASFDENGIQLRVLAPGERTSRRDEVVRYVWGPRTEVATVREVFRLYVHESLSPTEIARRLNERGQAWKHGGPWKDINVVHLLNNEIVTGVQAFNKSSTYLGKRTANHPVETWVRRRICPPMVSAQLFSAAKARRAALQGRARTDDEMLEGLRRLLARRGRLSSYLIEAAPDLLNCHSYRSRFGSIKAAYGLIGYDYRAHLLRNTPRTLPKTPDEILEGLRRLSREQQRLGRRLIYEDRRLPSVNYIRKTFGSLKAAYRAAGLDPEDLKIPKGSRVR